jgi:hypothetical protein
VGRGEDVRIEEEGWRVGRGGLASGKRRAGEWEEEDIERGPMSGKRRGEKDRRGEMARWEEESRLVEEERR